MSPPLWAYSSYDCQVHLLADEHLPNWLKARCGHLVPPTANQHERRPTGGQCPTCVDIDRVDLCIEIHRVLVR